MTSITFMHLHLVAHPSPLVSLRYDTDPEGWAASRRSSIEAVNGAVPKVLPLPPPPSRPTVADGLLESFTDGALFSGKGSLPPDARLLTTQTE